MKIKYDGFDSCLKTLEFLFGIMNYRWFELYRRLNCRFISINWWEIVRSAADLKVVDAFK